MSAALKVCIAQMTRDTMTETFIRAHAQRLPSENVVLHSVNGSPTFGDEPVLSQSFVSRAKRTAIRALGLSSSGEQITSAYLRAFEKVNPDVVLAEYGPMGVAVHEACKRADIPLVVHFHGFDASKAETLREFGQAYRRMFADAAAVVAVSRVMRDRLIQLGANPQTTHLNVYGIDCDRFSEAQPGNVDAIFLAVGRFVDKKAPHITIRAFSEALSQAPQAKLRMIGDGPLLAKSQELVRSLKIADAVEFLGAQSHDVVAQEMKACRALVQHSVTAPNGDCEGTPLAILEAGASGLPVISTRHAGIPDVVLEGETGLLVAEKDVDGMAEHISRLSLNPDLAAQMGKAARTRVEEHFSMEKSISGLFQVISDAVRQAKPATSAGR